MRRYSFRLLCGFLFVASFAWNAPLRAQDVPPGYPARPIRIVVPVVPGGGTVLATEISAKAAPDGYTFFAGTALAGASETDQGDALPSTKENHDRFA